MSLATDIDVFSALERRILRRLHVAQFGRVEKYDRAKQLADVQPYMTLDVLDLDTGDPDEPEKLPVIPAVRVLWLQGGKWSMHFDLPVGSSVLLLTLDVDHGPHQRSGVEADPIDLRRHHPGASVALPFDLRDEKALAYLADPSLAGKAVLGGEAEETRIVLDPTVGAEHVDIGGPNPKALVYHEELADILADIQAKLTGLGAPVDYTASIAAMKTKIVRGK